MNKRVLEYILALFCVLFFTRFGFSQLSKKHYIPPLTNSEFGNANPEGQYMYISTPNTAEIKYTIIPVGTTSANYISGMVSNTNPQQIYLGSGYGQLFIQSTESSLVKNDKGYIVDADAPIYVSVRMNAGGGAQAGAIVSKGLSALGTSFRVGSFTNENPQDNYLNFVSVMATENNTSVSFSDLPIGIVIKNYIGSTPVSISLNKGESYTIATNSFDTQINRDGLIGALVTSDKQIVVNCGSTNGSFHNGGGRDYGVDQIVDASKIGTEYIFVKGDGSNNWENILIVAHSDNTSISINGNNMVTTINAGSYYLIEGENYNFNGNMYVKTSQPVFAYQGVGATNSEANQGLFFVPPLSCEARGNLDNIANIDHIGTTSYSGGISVVTKVGSTITINDQPISNFATNGPNTVTGNSDYITYKVSNLTGNISVKSTDELYCAYFNQNNAATSGSFYSGFPTPPEINFDAAFITLGICIPNITLEVANMENFDSVEWYYNDGFGYVGTGISSLQYTPTEPGTYKLIGHMTCSNLTLESLEVPVSICPDDIDNDGIIDNIDIDNDNDGILNCLESFGNQEINLSNLAAGSLSVGDFVFSGTTSAVGNTTAVPFLSTKDGTIMSDLPSKLGTIETSATYKIQFNNPLNLLIEYATSNSLGNGMLTDDEEFVLQVSNNNTITLLNPENQLLVDTNYDGIFESGITQFSSFEIRFKLNGNNLAIGSGAFSFLADGVDELSYKHINNSDISGNQATFKISATCVPKDSDGDGIEDAFDYDSDNDGIPDIIENSGTAIILSQIDNDLNGLDDIFDLSQAPKDSDKDTVFDFYDLDSDNDGIYDLEESGSGLEDLNFDGIIDNINTTIGINGWDDNAESSPDSNEIGYIISDIDGDYNFNYFDLDSDGDLCSDVLEAGFSDGNNDDQLGNGNMVNDWGIVINASDGYTIPNIDYITEAPITITQQPKNIEVCETTSATFSIENTSVDNYQWEESSDGINWSVISDGSFFYSGATSDTLILLKSTSPDQNKQYRVQLSKTGNSCGLTSEKATLTVHPLPIVTPAVQLKQCDNDTDGFSAFNLFEATDKISTNSENEQFTFFYSSSDAINNLNPITNPTSYTNQSINSEIIWAQTKSEFGCISVSEVELIVSTTGIPMSYQRSFSRCDDDFDNINNDRDGISTFDFSSVDSEVRSIFPVGQQIIVKYYRNENDALAEVNEILDISNYRNIGYPNEQKIYIRVDSEIDNDCLGFGAHITLTVEPLPTANPVTIDRQCDDDFDGFFLFDVSAIESILLNGQTNVSVSYFDQNNVLLPSPLPNPFLTESQIIKIRVANNVTADPNGPCYDETTLEFIVDRKPVANSVFIHSVCDDESNDGLYEFDTSNIESTILGSQTGMEVHYFDDQGSELSSPLPNPFNSSSQKITASVINPININCVASTSLIFEVNPLPDFQVISPQIICLTEPPSSIILDVFQEDPKETLNYEWTNSQGMLLSTERIVQVSQPGSYFITLKKTDGTLCARTKEIKVLASEIAKINKNDIVVNDDSSNNTISIINEQNNLGLGDYEFALDNPYYGFQDEPFFNNITAGIHTVYVRDKNGCGTTHIDVSVIGFPKFFTPNGDGKNDLWQVIGISPDLYLTATIYIFDRFGKLIANIPIDSIGWDGFFNGENLPSTDYWFTAELEDLEGNIRIKKGHFSLIR